ncbi:putative disease resistance RPP13-like protein 2 [Cicer arietinum]|uniref:CC-NBS-LRR disease resistance protein n=1 Tax=Cicer arietinum TaxID=3827 RepID=A0A067XTG8_CICAR|nr:putative disease resistance RPP13-like protein 2 [Cicer arietinum]AGT75400.1 CC-NBS-LRR disease resistance protein [Cicer arietinum]
MADIAIDLVVSAVANSLSKILIEEFALLGGGTVRRVEWIERELRSMQGLLEQVEQRGYGEHEQDYNEWEDKLKEIACDAEDVIETFVIKSVKRKRWGILHWLDKYKVGKELEQIRRRMRDISHTGMNLNTDTVTVSVEASSSSSTTTSLVAPAVEKFDHILSQTIFTSDEVIEMVELVKGEFLDLQNKIVYNLNSTSERENVWLEEVKEVCNYTESIVGNFIVVKERRSKMSKLKKVLYLSADYASENKFKKQMKYIRTRIGDAVHRSLTYGVVRQDHDMGQTTPRSTPVPDLALERLLIVQIPFIIYYAVLLFVISARVWPMSLLLLITFDVFKIAGEQGRTEKLKPMSSLKKRWKGVRNRKEKRKLLLRFLLYGLTYVVIIILSSFLPIQATFLLNLSSLIVEIIAWSVNLQRSLDKNMECTQRYLNLMRAFSSDANTESVVLNERQKVWIGQLRVVSQNGQSLIDTAYPKGYLSRIKFAKDINCLLKEILYISDRKTIYGIATNINQQELIVPLLEGPISSIQESEIIVDSSGATSAPAQVMETAASLYQPVTGLKEKIQSIRGEKELMDALFLDVQEMGGELDGRSRIWVEQMRGISFEVEFLINEYGDKLEHEPALKYFFKCRPRHVISKKIDVIKNKIEDASRRRKAYGLVEIQSRVVSSSSSTVQILRARMQPSLVANAKGSSVIVGFDDDVHVLMAQLLSDEKRRCITCINGIEGTGKTTLARLMFDHNTVVAHFQCRLWVSVPSNSNCTAQQLLEEIVKKAAIQIEGQDSSTDYVLATLARTKYLIVVDGIKETSQVYLDTLKEAIPDTSTGSRILVTTRNANVAQHAADATFVHQLQLLDDETSWVLFTRHLNVDIPSELIKVGREIVIKCGGLPLNILIMSRLPLPQWSSLLEGQLNQDHIKIWSDTLDAINKNLPSYLRRCLFYFVLFPAEFGIPVRRLVVLWVAEGLLHHAEEDQVPLELVAERYLTELIDRNMVQVAKRKRNGKVKTCRLPNALRQLWLTKANESKFIQHRTATHSNADPKKSIIRRVADHLHSDDIWHTHIHGDTTSPNSSSQLRTYYKDVLSFMSFDAQEGSKPGQQVGNFLKRCISRDCFLLLRVLDLERVYKPKLPKRIARLTRLRYLGLRWTYLESLPSSISNLLKLQTLDLKHTYIHTLPTSIWKMELRHLFLSETYRTRFPSQPRGNSLSDLQTLWGLFVDEKTPVKDGLDKLVDITKLGLACQSMSLNQEAMVAQLEAVADWITKLEHLQSLRLKSRDEEGKPWILNLKSFVNNVNLTDMYLLGSLNSSSVLLSQFPLSLVELTLSHSKLQDDPMKLLKDFPNLRTLRLLAESYVQTTIVCESQSFPQLHVLKLWMLEHLDEWKIEQGALSCLRQLEIRSCLNLKMLPDGLKHVDTLLELKLTNMPIRINADAHNIPPNCQVVKTSLQ